MQGQSKISERKYYMDNIRWITVVIVMVYHVIYIFNSQGVLSNFGVQGIELLDGFLYIVYPWFMCLLFVVAGACAKYSLDKKSNKEFLKDRFKRLLIPAIFVPFIFGWFSGWVSDYYADIFQGNGGMIPGIVKYLIYSLSGQGPVWFAKELFFASVFLVVIRKLDKKQKLDNFFNNMKWWGFLILFFSFWISAYLFNTPLIEVYRNGIYFNCFFMGYYIFSNQNHIETLEKARKFLFPAACVCMIGYYAYVRIVIEPQATDNILTRVAYTTKSVLQHPFTNLFAWVMILMVFSVARKYLNFHNAFSTYMTNANFAYYILHYPCLTVVAFAALEVLGLPIWACYAVNLFGMILLTTGLYFLIRKIPVVRTVTLGIDNSRRRHAGKIGHK